MKTTLAIALVLFAMALPAKAEWKEVGYRDFYRVVLVDPGSSQETKVYWDAIRKICGKSHCNIAFFSDEKLVPPSGERLGEGHLKQALLIYNTSKGFAWNCQLRPDADNCFTW